MLKTKHNIRKLRRAKNITQVELAKLVGYKQKSSHIVYEWERGMRTPPTRILPKLAEVLGCSIDDLFRDDGPLDTDAS